MSDETLCRVVFNGRVTGEFDMETTRRNSRQLFRLHEKTVARIFAAHEAFPKVRIPESVAVTYAIKLASKVCECRIGTGRGRTSM